VNYGALSAPQGRIAISGSIDRHNAHDVLIFSWTESGGPRVAAPTRCGFDSVILHDAAQQLGEVTLEYRNEGLSYQAYGPKHAAVPWESWPRMLEP
jgi:two-component sensor histidine kinase